MILASAELRFCMKIYSMREKIHGILHERLAPRDQGIGKLVSLEHLSLW